MNVSVEEFSRSRFAILTDFLLFSFFGENPGGSVKSLELGVLGQMGQLEGDSYHPG